MVSSKPTSLSYIEAATAPVVAVTAWQALFDHAKLKTGQRVVIHGAAGSVGAYAVQLARRTDLQIVATASADDAALVRDLGADTVIDYKTELFEETNGQRIRNSVTCRSTWRSAIARGSSPLFAKWIAKHR